MAAETQEKISVLSFGAGAIGTYIGGSLAHRQHRVVFLERPAEVQPLRDRGLKLKLEDQTIALDDPLVVGSLEEALALGPYDLALFAMKAYDTAGALQEITPFERQMPPILCLQNGVSNETAIAAVLGKDRVIAATVTSAIERRAAGDITLQRLRGMGVAATHPLSARLVNALNDAGLNARLYSHAADMKWSKMLTNLLANASSAILDMTPEEIFAHPKLYELEVQQLREALQVMRAQRLQIVDLPGTPVRALGFAVRSLPTKLARTLLKNAVGGGRGGKMPSFYIDLKQGRGKSEVEALNGAVVAYGAQSNIPTPVNRLLTETLLGLTRAEIKPSQFAKNPDALLARLENP